MLTPYAQQTMVDTMPIAACVFTGADHTISAANSLMLGLWNRGVGVIGKSLAGALPELAASALPALLSEVLSTGKTHRAPEVLLRPPADRAAPDAYADVSFKPLRDHEGQIYGVVATAVDITEKVKALSDLEQTVTELSALNEEYLSLNEELEAGSEELTATNEELYQTRDELRRSLAELSLAEERTRLATDAVGLGIYDHDLLTGAFTTSDKLAEIFGFAAPVSLQTYRDSLHPDDRQVRDAAYAQALASGELSFEARAVRPDRAIRWVRVEGKVSYNEQGEPARIVGTLMDVTEQRQDKEVQRKLKTLADNSADLMSLLELDGVNSYINEAGKKLLGFESDEEVLLTPISELHRPEDFEQVSREVLPSVMNEGRWIGNMLVRHLKTGEVFPVLNYTIRIDDPVSGKPLAVGAIMRDLRPELAAKKALADSEELLRNVTSASPTALWMAGPQGEMTYVNQTWETWTCRPVEAHLGEGWLQNIPAEDREQVRADYQAALTAREPFELEYRIADTSGNTRWCLATGQPLLDSHGGFMGFAGACVDLTIQKELQQHKDDFISIASHELKTPITSLKASLQLIDRLRTNPKHPMLPQLLTQARKSTERVSGLVDELLNVGRLQQGHMELNMSSFMISDLLRNCANLVALSGKKDVRIDCDPELSVVADEGRIEQVVTNLLSNAVKYAPATEVIMIVVSRYDDHVRVTVTDQGPGIAADQVAQLFERYYRAPGSTRHISGLGLGLYISKEIIIRHGGDIGVDSELGKGSTFWFTLPL